MFLIFTRRRWPITFVATLDQLTPSSLFETELSKIANFYGPIPDPFRLSAASVRCLPILKGPWPGALHPEVL